MDWVREWVSSGRSRLKTSNFNLDLSYITPRLIAMSYPAAGVEGQFRNHVDDVSAFLNERYYAEQHAHYMVYNLSGRTYNYQKFHNQVFDFPFPDHFPPTLTQLFKLCVTLDSWLNALSGNFAVISQQSALGEMQRTIISPSYFSRKAGVRFLARELRPLPKVVRWRCPPARSVGADRESEARGRPDLELSVDLFVQATRWHVLVPRRLPATGLQPVLEGAAGALPGDQLQPRVLLVAPGP